MAEIVQLSEYRQRNLIHAGFRLWRRCFKQDFSAQTRLNDLSPAVLGCLAEPTEASTLFYYSLILGLLGYGEEIAFETLVNSRQVRVVDMHLFLADQVRFEMMRRLGWLSRFSATQYHLVDIVLEFDHIRTLCRQDPPLLAASHQGYAQYKTLIDQDRQVFIRRMLPSVLEQFKKSFPV